MLDAESQRLLKIEKDTSAQLRSVCAQSQGRHDIDVHEAAPDQTLGNWAMVFVLEIARPDIGREHSIKGIC